MTQHEELVRRCCLEAIRAGTGEGGVRAIIAAVVEECEAIARAEIQRVVDSYDFDTRPSVETVADAIAALKGNGEGK